jgi:hypothetical protein
VLAAIDGAFAEVEPHDAVVSRQRLGGETVEDPAPIHSPSMTSERVIIDGRGRKQCRHRVPDSIDHLGIQRAHDAGCLHSMVWVECTESNSGQTRPPVDGHRGTWQRANHSVANAPPLDLS